MNSGPGTRTFKKSGSGFSLWSRKSLKRSNTANSIQQPTPIDVTSRIEHVGSDDQLNTPHNGFQRQNSFQSSILSHPRRDMSPSAGEPVTWGTVPVAAMRVQYNIHNPLGPRWYKNYHLIPPSENRPGARPPTFFSPSFPPISTSNLVHNGDSENSSRAASKSPLPTPASSQTRVNEGVKPRSRKTSQTAPDTVDLLDVTDPWGTNWHHESPYDVGQASIAPDGQGPRVRRASMTAAQNTLVRALNPSQLSQSTSAVHLHSLGQPSLPPTKPTSQTIQLPRKLSKKRPGTEGLFTPPTQEDRKAISAPPTPVERIYLADSPPPDPGSLPKRMSVAPPVTPPFNNFAPQSFQSTPTPKKEKRASMLNRIAKKFSLLAKSPSDENDQPREYSWLHVDAPGAPPSVLNHSLAPQHAQGLSERASVKRVPPPSIHPTPEPVTPPKKDTVNSRRSYASVEEPFMIGNLTVANPDSPESDKGAPSNLPETVSQPIPLHFDSAPAVLTLAGSPPSAPRDPSIAPSRSSSPGGMWAMYEKPLPIPIPSAVNTPHVDPKDISPEGSDTSSISEEAEADVARSKTVSSTATRTTLKPPAKPPAPVSEVGEETNQSAISNHATVDELSTLSPSVPPPKDVEKTPLHVTSPSLPPIPISTPFANTISLRPTSQISAAPELPPKVPQLPPLIPPSQTRNSVATNNAYLTPMSPEEVTSQDRINSFLGNSPYSTSSMLANPPTPYNHRASIPLTPEPEVPPLPPAKPPKDVVPRKETPKPAPKETVKEPEEKEPERRDSGETSPMQTTRQTETFKLVRSLSGNAVQVPGNVFASAETIPGAGQQWEVVEDKVKQKSRRDKEGSGRRESKDASASRQDSAQESKSRPRGARTSKQPSGSQEVSTIPMPKASEDPYDKYRDDQRRHTKHRSEDDYRREERKRREEQARQEEERRQEEIRRYEEDRRRRRDKREREERRERERLEREWYEKEREKEFARQRELERLEVARLEQERLARELEKERIEKERLALELEREKLKREKEKERDRRKEEDRARERRRAERKEAEAARLRAQQEEERLALERERERLRRQEEEQRRRDDQKRRSEQEARSRSSKLRKSEHRQSAAPRDSYISYTHQSSSSSDRPLERRPSVSTRPTSELPSAADLNALRAKEAWEMERLWKARSMYGAEWNSNAVAPQPPMSVQDAAAHAAAYGSSHTAFVVSAPFQQAASGIYHSMPNKPAPIVYGSPASIPSLPDSAYDPYERPVLPRTRTAPQSGGYAHDSPSSLLAASNISRSALLNNPLPEPPRESTYKPSPLPPMNGASGRSNTDPQWLKYTGITTTS